VSAVRHVRSVDEAVSELSALGEDGAALAGGTWVMRSPLRGESMKRCYVALAGVEELRRVDLGDGAAELGALLTHTELALLGDAPALAGLARAAACSAFPAVRNVATLGGNLCADGFAEADLVPALLAADASVVVRSSAGERREPVLASLAPGDLVVGVSVPTPAGWRSSFERLTVRAGGEYAVASVAVSALVVDGAIRQARVAVGSVQPRARLCEAAGRALAGVALAPGCADDAGAAARDECSGRDGLDAPGWYREAVLPHLVQRAVMGLGR
jgi:carbon-monoxide dehydrogenase medium subunit